MSQRLRSLGLTVALVAVGSGQGNPGDLRLACDAAAFAPTIGAADLVQRFGVLNVVTDSILLGEGEFERGTIVFRSDPMRRIEIVWRDSTAQRFPRFVRIRGDSSHWVARSGITLGSRLRTLERLNGKPFQIMGFAFDDAGAVSSWSGGRLSGPADSVCALEANLEASLHKAADRRWFSQVTDDRAYSSANPAMQALNPRVIQLAIVYPSGTQHRR